MLDTHVRNSQAGTPAERPAAAKIAIGIFGRRPSTNRNEEHVTYPPQYAPLQQGYPQAPPQGYNGPPPPMGYNGQQPAFYPPQQQPQQGYGQPQAPQGPPLAKGSLEAFDNQRGTSFGKGLDFPVPGTQYLVRVGRDITDADVRQMTKFKSNNEPLFNTDGTAKMQLCIPGVITPDANHPSGGCTLYIKPGAWRDEYNRALAEAGITGHARGGDVIWVVFANFRPSGMGNPAKVPQMVVYPKETADQTLGALAPPHAPIDQAVASPAQGMPQQQYAQPYPPAAQQPQYAPPQGYPAQAPQQPVYAPQVPAQPPAQPQYQQPPQYHQAPMAQQMQPPAPPQHQQPMQPPAQQQPPAPQPPQAPPGTYTGDPARDAMMAQLTGYGQPQQQG